MDSNSRVNRKFDTLLVTGGAGFIGSNFIHYMMEKYPRYKIINLDKLTYAGNLENLRDVENNASYRFVKGDICDRNIVERIFSENRIDAIINFAAESHVDRSIEDPGVFIQTDVYGAFILLEAAKKYNTGVFLQISTDEVYGSILEGSFKEADPLAPNSPYSASKTGAEMIVRSFFKTYGTPVLITRTSNNFGPYQYPEKLIPLFVTNLIDNKKVPLYGDGMNVRDWIYVADNCRALDVVLHNGRIGEIYNIGAGNEKPNIWITKKIIELVRKDESFIQPVEDRLGHDRRYSVDCTKIEQELGWKPETDFSTALEKTVKWYIENENWWRPLKKTSITGEQ
ncbi:MAG: dTDP-glucose 4,6-dehydratase [Actinobacteria bacterium]|nr:dTDP-glucose 4,6-dehydratase [Actinomycetota bacterium]